jgi:NAD(P)-dependent dehydrogenase (short-subunit alcohol dehydrogenase family)
VTHYLAASPTRKAILITGAASGIGLAAAEQFVREGAVGLADIDAAGAAAVSSRLGTATIALPLDVRERAQWSVALERFAQFSGGRLDVLLNNAGIARYGWFEEVSGEEMDLIVDINLKGVLNGAYQALDLLRATPGARLLNVGSCAGLVGAPRQTAYCATKFAVRGLSDALGVEFSRFGVTVAYIMPWFVDTPILDSGSARGNGSFRTAIADANAAVCTVEEAADVIWAAANGEDSAYVVGKSRRQLRFMARFFRPFPANV